MQHHLKPDHERVLSVLTTHGYTPTHKIAEIAGCQDNSMHRALHTLRHKQPYKSKWMILDIPSKDNKSKSYMAVARDKGERSLRDFRQHKCSNQSCDGWWCADYGEGFRCTKCGDIQKVVAQVDPVV